MSAAPKVIACHLVLLVATVVIACGSRYSVFLPEQYCYLYQIPYIFRHQILFLPDHVGKSLSVQFTPSGLYAYFECRLFSELQMYFSCRNMPPVPTLIGLPSVQFSPSVLDNIVGKCNCYPSACFCCSRRTKSYNPGCAII